MTVFRNTVIVDVVTSANNMLKKFDILGTVISYMCDYI